MAVDASGTVRKYLETLFRVGTVAGLPDGPLLERFLGGPDEVAEGAFAAIVERHGPMVLRVCGQILGERHAAEDASQATFLVLARKARSIRRSDSVAGWLYGVACRIATRAKRDMARRRAHERRGAEMAVKTVDEKGRPETWPELYEELGRLPEKFRLPIVLHHLEGLSYEQAAQQLRCPVRTIQSRLARGRERLRARLARRGVGPTAALLAAALVPDVTSAAVSDAWKQSTVRAAIRYAAGGTSAATVSTSIAALAQGALRTMMLEKLNSVAAAAVLLGAVACGMAAWARSAPPAIDAPDGRHRATMADGTTIEVVGVSTHPSGPKTWWKPDGSPFDEAPADPFEARMDDDEDQVRTVLVRVEGLPKGATLKWLPADVRNYWGGRATKDGQKVPGLELYVASFPKDRAACSVRARVAAGPWETEMTHDGSGGYSAYHGPHKFYFGKARAFQDGTAIAVAQNITDRDSRVVAVDHNGNVHPPIYSSGAGGEILSLLDVEFRLPPDQIREYQVQSRPFEHAEIKDIALRPRQAGK